MYHDATAHGNEREKGDYLLELCEAVKLLVECIYGENLEMLHKIAE